MIPSDDCDNEPAPRAKANSAGPSAGSPSQPNPAGGELAETAPGETLSPEEQMERYEAYLKETDWGHRPC